MTERDIFLDALERDDPVARAAYLDDACAGQPMLRRRIEELLRCHGEDTKFLNVPAMEQLVAAEKSLSFLGQAAEPGSLGRLDHYEVLDVIGRGSTGIVLKARDTKLQRVVAVKTLAPRLAASAAARQRFIREAQAAAAVRDDNVVSIYAVSEDSPVPYLVMEYISGLSLDQRLQQSKALELNEILRIGMQLAAGLAAAHAQGLVHRDIKPGNILLENGVQRVKITDFGLARVAADADTSSGNALAGTPSYMSPEQARGEPTDHRTDLFSLGSVLYTLCARRPPFRADTTAGVLSCVREAAPQPVREINPEVPLWLSGLIDKLHAREANARPASAQEVADLLRCQLARLQEPTTNPVPLATVGEAEQAAPTSTQPPGIPGCRRLAVAIALIAMLVALGAAAVLSQGWQQGIWESEGNRESDKRGPQIPLDLRRENISPQLLALAGAGDPTQAPPELAAVLGDGRFLLPRFGQSASMDQSPDGKMLAVPLDEDVVLLDVSSGVMRRILHGPGGRVFHVTFSRDSRLLAASTRYEQNGGAVRVWDVQEDRILFTSPQPGPTVACAAAFSGDGQHLFAEGNGHIHVWETRTGMLAQDIEIEPRGVGSMRVSPDGSRLAVAVFFDRCARVFDWDGKKLTEPRTLKGHSAFVDGVVYSPDGKFLATGSQKELRLWHADTLDFIKSIQTPAQQLTFDPTSDSLVAAWTIGEPKPTHTFSRWSTGTWTELPALALKVSADPLRVFPRLSNDGKVMFLTPQYTAGNVRAFDMGSGKELFPRIGHLAPVNAVAISPDGHTAASAGDDFSVKIWDLATCQLRHSLTAHTAAVYGLGFSPNGKLLASASRDGTVALWDVANGTEVHALHGQTRSPSRVQFSPDGTTVAAGSEGGIVKRWDVSSGKERRSLEGHTGVVRCVAYSRDGKLLASGGEDKNVCIHDLATGNSKKLTMPSAVNEVAFSPDSLTLAAVCDSPNAVVQLWNLQTGEATTWEGHTGHVYGVAFSPTGSTVATCAADGTVRLWDRNAAAPGMRTIGPGPFGGDVKGVAFTPDGRYLATANANGIVYLLRVDQTSP